jgi:hypothetical protein
VTTNREAAPPRRLMNVSLLAGSPAQRAYHDRAGLSLPAITPDQLAPGFQPQPALNLTNHGGRTITDLVFVNQYLGGPSAWVASDITQIDGALSKALSDAGLQTVLQQYYGTPISSRMLPSAILSEALPPMIYKDQVEALVAQVYTGGALAGADVASTVINIMLPRGVVLVDGFSPGYQPPAAEAAEHQRRERAVVTIDNDAADSKHGLGGYHGSTHVTAGGTATVVYYAVGVYSEGNNGIPAFAQPWMNVVGTFYHELNEARTDPDVEEAIRTNDNSWIGWYSDQAGEIGDIPIDEVDQAGASLGLIFKQIGLAGGPGTVPIQLMWSNKDAGPASQT